MRRIFGDAGYFIALLAPDDQWHDDAVALRQEARDAKIVTTDEVLTEFLAALSDKGSELRERAVRSVIDMHRVKGSFEVLPQTRASFNRGLRFYSQRPDKSYSLIDCISMETMVDRRISEVLTFDYDFAREGRFVVLRPAAPSRLFIERFGR